MADTPNKHYPLPPEYPADPVIEALEIRLSHLACDWRSEPSSRLVKQYHDTYHQLRALGWDAPIDADAELPYDLMPQDYLDRYRLAPASPSTAV